MITMKPLTTGTNARQPMIAGTHVRRLKRLIWMGGLLAVLVSGMPLGLFAQGFLMPEDDPGFRQPRPNRPVVETSYQIRELLVDASIQGQVATTQVTQVFENTGQRQIAASFVFPLPYDGAVDKMTFLVDGKEYEARLLPADKAREIYEGYVRRNQDPALLEWIGTGMFRTSVFPIPAGATRTVTLKYSQLLKKDNSLTDYLFPMSAAKYTSRPMEKFGIRVAIASDADLKSIYSPTHNIQIDRDDARNVVVRHMANGVTPASDFRLVFDSVPGKLSASLMSYWPADAEQGYFALLASPEIASPDEKPVSKTVIFVVDQSGSMSGVKIDQAREAAKFVLQNLRENDLFNVIRYEGSVATMAPELQRFDDTSRQTATGFVNSINAGGSTNIDEALKTAMGMIQNNAQPAYIVFLTDGMPTVGETNEIRIAKNAKEANRYRARLISFGVGYDVNSRLLDRLTRENFGQSEYVSPNEDIESAVANLYRKMTAPVLTDVKVRFLFDGESPEDGQIANRIYPTESMDLFAGSQMVIIGRYSQAGPAKIKIAGQVGAREETYQYDVRFHGRGETSAYPFVQQLWAVRRIGEIIDLLDLQGKNAELIDELVQLSTRHGIVTPYTSYLADESAPRNQLSDFRGNRSLTEMRLGDLEESSGDSAFRQRSAKQQFKKADNLAAESLPTPAGGAGGGFGGGGLGGGASGGGPGVTAGIGNSGVQRIGNTTLYRRGNLLVSDNAIKIDVDKDPSVIKIKKFSKEYFELIANNSADENQVLSQQGSEELLIVLRGKPYLIQ